MAAKRPSLRDNDDDNGTPVRRGRVDPLIQALLGHLPAPHTVWPPQERQKWLGMLGDALGVIYKDAEPPRAPGQTPHGNPQTGPVRSPSGS